MTKIAADRYQTGRLLSKGTIRKLKFIDVIRGPATGRTSAAAREHGYHVTPGNVRLMRVASSNVTLCLSMKLALFIMLIKIQLNAKMIIRIITLIVDRKCAVYVKSVPLMIFAGKAFFRMALHTMSPRQRHDVDTAPILTSVAIINILKMKPKIITIFQYLLI